MPRRFVLLGASRGLGWATYQQLNQQNPESLFFLSSRKILSRQRDVSAKTHLVAQDFSVLPLNLDFLNQIKSFEPTDLIYFAGGGPYGNFADKKWSDHLWALTTTFLYPAELLHLLLSQNLHFASLENIVVVGSAVAEARPDPKAASYAAAKHALKGLIDTLQLEPVRPRIQIFSPGYMQTDLLPVNSQPRQEQRAENPVNVAQKLIAMIEKND